MWKIIPLVTLALLGYASVAMAHFGMLIPSKPMVLEKKESALSFTIAFAHPMERNGMTMEKPKSFVCALGENKTDLTDSLEESLFMKHKAWKATYSLKKPGVYRFAVEPQPYFEPAEDCYIVHYTKILVPAFGEEEGWDEPMNLKTEIIPLTRPFGNYAGNVFQGRVLLDGKPTACEVEVEYYNKDGKYHAPNDYYVTQVVKTDANGVFTFVCPWEGYWGFAALNTASEKMDHQGEAKNVELGAVLWLYFGKSEKK